MTRANRKRRMALCWWLQLILALLPALVLNHLYDTTIGMMTLPLFALALVSLFVSLPLFRHYKHALLATAKALDTAQETAAWEALQQRRTYALIGASLPAWVAALALFAGLEPVPMILLLIATVVLFYLYRLPRQLG